MIREAEALERIKLFLNQWFFEQTEIIQKKFFIESNILDNQKSLCSSSDIIKIKQV